MARPRLLVTIRVLCCGLTCALGRAPGVSAATWVDPLEGGTIDGVVTSAKGLGLAPRGKNLLVDPGFDVPAKDVKQTVDPYGGRTHPTDGWERNGVSGREMEMRQARLARSNGTAWELEDIMEKGEPAILQRIPFRPEYRGRRFIFRLWARTVAGAHSRAMIAFKWRGKTHWRCDTKRPIAIDAQWREFTLEDRMPEDADEIGVVIGPYSYIGKGSTIVDDAWLSLAEYRPQGTYTSAVHDTGTAASQVWRARWRGHRPRGTSVRVAVRTGAAPEPDAKWSDWELAETNPDTSLRVLPGRYVQYRVALETGKADSTPTVDAVRLCYGSHLGFVEGRALHSRTNAPVNAATVRVGQQTCTSGVDGRFVLGVSAGKHAMAASCLHYLRTASSSIDVEEGKRIAQDVLLKPDPNWCTFRGDSQRQAFSALSGRLKRWRVAWRYDLGRERHGSVLVEDVTGDQVKEILVAAGGALAAYDLTGKRLWRLKGWELGSIKGVYDVPGNGEKQVVCVSEGWWPYANGAFTVVRGRDGRMLSRVDSWPDAGDIGHGLTHDHLHGSFSVLSRASTVVADLDGDGKLEIAVHPNYHSRVLAYHFDDGLQNVKPMWETPGRFKYDLYIYPILCDDIDGDGKLEIVYHDDDMVKLFNAADGSKKGEVSLGCTGGLFGEMACRDVDGDGRKEIFLIPRVWRRYKLHTVACAGWDTGGLVKRWSRDFAGKIRTGTSSGGLAGRLTNVDDQDGLELTVQAGSDVHVLDASTGKDKHVIVGAQLKATEDVDRDGLAEIVVRKRKATEFFRGIRDKMAKCAISYPADQRWQDWGDGELRRWRWGSGGRIEIVDRSNSIQATLPAAPYMVTPIAADLDGDGAVEVVVRDSSGHIRVLDARRGSPRQREFPALRCDRDGSVTRGGGVTACDLDGDGRRELVFRRGGRLKVTDYAGQELFASKQGSLRHPAIGDFNGDGVKDIACYSAKRWTAFDWKHKKVIWTVDAPESNEVGAWDVDGDGMDELAGKHGPAFMIDGSDGRTLWTAFRREMCALGLGTFADLTGDGLMEVLITGEYTNTAWRTTGENLWWIGWSSGGNKEHYCAMADLNGDGASDVGISSNHGVFYCVDGRSGQELWTYRIPQMVTLTHPAAADIDSDGRAEFVFGTMTGLLVVLNGEDGSVAKTMALGEPVGAPIVADVDNDGEAEVLFVCGSHLHCVGSGP